MSSSGVDEVIKFTWRIENSDFLWLATSKPSDITDRFTTKILRSPFISVGNPCHTIFHLNINARIANCRGRLVLNYELIRLNGSFDGCVIGQVSLERPNGRSTTLPVYNSLLPSRGLFVHQRFLLQETITLQCQFIFSNPYQYYPYLTKLKQTINSWYSTGEFSDLILCTTDKEFFVHKFFLHKRAPKLLEDLGTLEENCTTVRKKVDKISTPVLETLLQYIYSGELNVLPKESLPELYEYLEKYQFQELMNVLHLENSATITTQLKVIRKILRWKADVESTLNDLCEKNILYETIYFENVRFLVKICFKTILSSAWLDMCVHCLGSLDEDILMSCTLSSGSRKDILHKHKKIFLCNSTQDQINFGFTSVKLNYNFKDLKRGLYLMLNLAVSKGRDLTSVDYVSPSQPEHFSMLGMGVMRYAMKKDSPTFYLKNSGDVSLCFNCGRVLSAHKIVLVAWSPVFAAMFHHEMTEKESGKVIIIDIDYQSGEMLLRFMYSGVLLEYSFEEYQKLFVAADKYQVLLLLNYCRSFLSSHLTLDNACDMLELADRHGDQMLLETVQKYLTTNASKILNSSDWMSLIETCKELVSKTLAYISQELCQLERS